MNSSRLYALAGENGVQLLPPKRAPGTRDSHGLRVNEVHERVRLDTLSARPKKSGAQSITTVLSPQTPTPMPHYLKTDSCD